MQLSMKTLGVDLTLPYYDNIHVMMTQLVSQTLCSVSKLDPHMAPHREPRYNTFMQLSIKVYVMMTQLMSQTLTMHCMLMQCASVSTCSVST